MELTSGVMELKCQLIREVTLLNQASLQVRKFLIATAALICSSLLPKDLVEKEELLEIQDQEGLLLTSLEVSTVAATHQSL